MTILDREPVALPEDLPVTQCVSWSGSDDTALVRCWALSGQALSVCGHGLLCAGVAWLRHGGGVATLSMNGLPVAFADPWCASRLCTGSRTITITISNVRSQHRQPKQDNRQDNRSFIVL